MTTKRAADVVPGDCVRLGSGREMNVTRIERNFLGLDNLICFVEDTQQCWFAHAVFVTDDVNTVSPAAPLDR
jgi:hypothetical protein